MSSELAPERCIIYIYIYIYIVQGSSTNTIILHEYCMFCFLMQFADFSLVWLFLEKYIFCYIHGHHKQYILVDTIFNYMSHCGLPGTCLYLSPQTSARKMYFPDCVKDIFLEAQHEKCS